MKREAFLNRRRFGEPAIERHLFLSLCFFFIAILLPIIISYKIAIASSEDPEQMNEEVGLQTEHDHSTQPLKMRIYWKDGLQLNGRYNRWRFVVGGSVMLDAGQLNADEEIEQAFPDFRRNAADIRQLRMHSLFITADFLEFRLDMDFANVCEIKDNRIRFTTIPFIKQIQPADGHRSAILNLTMSNSKIKILNS